MSYQPFYIEGADRPSQWLVTCDHAANTVPQSVNGGTLGVAEADMNRHIAYDVGACGLASELAKRLDAPFIRSNFSRLVVDPNRGEDDPTLLMKLYDGTIIPANRHAGPDELERRMALCHRPYHAALETLAAQHPNRAILAIHSFTPRLRAGPPRPWKVAVLSAADRRIADPLVRQLSDLGQFPVGDNEPYSGHLPGDSIDRHALSHGRLNILVELRNDLIETPGAQAEWADLLAPILDASLAEAQL